MIPIPKSTNKPHPEVPSDTYGDINEVYALPLDHVIGNGGGEEVEPQEPATVSWKSILSALFIGYSKK